MAVLFTNLSWWAWSGKAPESSFVSSTSPSLSSSETLKFSSAKTPTTKERRTSKRKWNSREERRTTKVDREYDLVLVPSDGGSSSSESDDSDWSIGWNEPLAPDFHTQVDTDNSFAVLVPCYGGKQLLDASTIVGYSTESNGFLEQWLTSLQNG